MSRTIMITGATDGLGLEAAKLLAAGGHRLLLHGRSVDKLRKAQAQIGGETEIFRADLAKLNEVGMLADAVSASCETLDVLINNAGVFKTSDPVAPDGRDVRIVVNTLAPALLAQRLLPRIPEEGRVINLSSAAQSPVDVQALSEPSQLAEFEAYAQSKLALTMWTRAMANAHPDGPTFIALNPGSLLATKMVKEGFDMAGNDIAIGARIIASAALDPKFDGHSGEYFDNDAGDFAPPHEDAMNPALVSSVSQAIDMQLPRPSQRTGADGE